VNRHSFRNFPEFSQMQVLSDGLYFNTFNLHRQADNKKQIKQYLHIIEFITQLSLNNYRPKKYRLLVLNFIHAGHIFRQAH